MPRPEASYPGFIFPALTNNRHVSYTLQAGAGQAAPSHPCPPLAWPSNTMPTLSPSAISEAFPFESFREGQERAIEKILHALIEQDKKFAILDGPTGSGKSVLALTISRFFEDSFYLTSTKILQDQLTNEFGGTGEVVDLKGRTNYPCTWWEEHAPHSKKPPNKPAPYVNCAEGFCKRRLDKAKCAECVDESAGITCAYWNRVGQAKRAKMAVMNFSSFLFQTEFGAAFSKTMPDGKRQTKRSLLIIDEAHNAEGQLMDFVSVQISDVAFKTLKLPHLETAAEYALWCLENRVEDMVRVKIVEALREEDAKTADYWRTFLSKLENFLHSDHDAWSAAWRQDIKGLVRTVELKPIFVREYAHRLLFDKADKVLMMSATIISPNQIAESLNIDANDMFAYRMANRFPVENRPLFFMPVGSMSYKNREATMPAMIDKIVDLCRGKHPDDRGIIHSHSFWLSERIYHAVPKDVRRRLLYQKHFQDKRAMLATHEVSSNSIILAPAMHEGLDLKDDLGRFSILCKVPFPNLNDNPQLKKRTELSRMYYLYLVCLKLVQSYGRTVRSETDWAIAYMLDEDFGRFLAQSKRILPGWFTEAIKRVEA